MTNCKRQLKMEDSPLLRELQTKRQRWFTRITFFFVSPGAALAINPQADGRCAERLERNVVGLAFAKANRVFFWKKVRRRPRQWAPRVCRRRTLHKFTGRMKKKEEFT
jgi:hypothetical protein